MYSRRGHRAIRASRTHVRLIHIVVVALASELPLADVVVGVRGLGLVEGAHESRDPDVTAQDDDHRNHQRQQRIQVVQYPGHLDVVRQRRANGVSVERQNPGHDRRE